LTTIKSKNNRSSRDVLSNLIKRSIENEVPLQLLEATARR